MRATRRSIRIGNVCCAVFLASLGMDIGAQPTIPTDDLARCAEIATDAVRLACFDALAGELQRTENREPATPAATTGSADESSSRDDSDNVDAFGRELLDDGAARGPDSIESRLIGEFTGWRGNTVFALENGQRWRQADNDRLVYRADSPAVTIRRGAFGAYRLSVEGVNRAVRVRRIE